MAAPQVKNIQTIADLRSDPKNPNRGTPRGHSIIERSIRQHGAGRSGLAAKDGTMIAGSQTLDEMQALGMKVKPVHTNGEEWVVVIRDDVEPGSEQADLLGLADNRASELGLNLDPAVLASLSQKLDLSPLWTKEELQEVTGEVTTFQLKADEGQEGLDQKKPVICPACGHSFSPS